MLVYLSPTVRLSTTKGDYYDKKMLKSPSKKLASETIAIRELLKVKTDLINGNIKKVDNANLTVSEWMDIWYDENERRWAITTRADRKRIVKKKKVMSLKKLR